MPRGVWPERADFPINDMAASVYAKYATATTVMGNA